MKALQKELKQCEEKIESLETQKKQAEEEIAKPEVYSNFDKLKIAQERFDSINASLNEATQVWETWSNKLINQEPLKEPVSPAINSIPTMQKEL